MRKKVISLLLAVCLALGMLPVSAFAEENPFAVKLNGEALALAKTEETFTDDATGLFDLPVYEATVPAGTPDDATVSLEGDVIAAAPFSNPGQELDLTAVPVQYDDPYVLIGANAIAPAYMLKLVKEESATCQHSETETVWTRLDSKTEHVSYTKCSQCGERLSEDQNGLCADDNGNGLCDKCGGEMQTASGEACLTVLEGAPTGGTVQAGELYELDLSKIFADSEHTAQYSFETTVSNQHTQIKDGIFYFSAAAGTYEVTLKAKCEAAEVSHKLTVTVEAGNAGIPEQYNYDETDQASVKVYVTLSSDGYPVSAVDGTALSHLEVTVPYFDLEKYGLQDYYRYGTNGGQGEYTGSTVIKRPTGLHLYIYLLERYYLGLDEEDCGQGTSGVLSYSIPTDVYYMDGGLAYKSDGKAAFAKSGSPTSLYMVNFWGHDENLMYFRNHCYPYMSPGWGSTYDYILLSDGDTWDVAMFTNWEFHNYGYFAKFDQDEYTAEAGKALTVETQKWGTSAATAGFADVSGLNVGLYSEEWELIAECAYTEGNSITVTAPAAAGTYYLMALDPNAQDTKEACIAPATAVLTVAASAECETHTDADRNRICDACNANLNHAPTLKEGVTETTAKIQTGMPYQLDDLMGGKIFQDEDGDSFNYQSYSYRKSFDGGKTWGDWAYFENLHGTVTSNLNNSVAGTYLYEFRAWDGYEFSVDNWFLTLEVLDVMPANVNFYLSRDHQYSTTEGAEHLQYPVLELYRTAGIDGDLYDYVGWFTNAEGKTEYVYNPQDYTIIDGETDYVVIGETQYELHDYEKITFTNSTFDDADETATPSNTVVENYNMFYVTVTTGRYSTRIYGYNAETGKYDIYLGGQSMELPREKDIYGGGGNDLYLRQISVYTTSKKQDSTYFTADDYYAEMVMPITGSMIHAGDPYVKGNYTYFPFFSWASGNGSLYNTYVYPYDTENYVFAQSINNTTSKSPSIATQSLSIGSAAVLTVHVPESGDFGLYFQYNNFHTKEVEPYGEAVVNGDGTKTLTYRVTKSNSNYTWRLTDPSGKHVTKAGWLASMSGAVEKTITFSGSTDKASHDFSNLGTAVDTRDEADIQVFLSDSGFKSVSGKTRVRAYRMWQLINTDPGNIMLEPDFNIQVLSGNASDVSLESGGNALNNWIDVTPTTTDIVAVNYNALDVIHTNDSYGAMAGFFPATNPERTNVFVITNQAAGSSKIHIAFNGSKGTDRGSDWDYNYDTWFYLDKDAKPNLDFTVSSSGEPTVTYAYVTTGSNLKSTMSGWNYATVDENGFYNVSLLPFRNAGTKGGTVIIKSTDSTGTVYALVRVAEMTANLENLTMPGEPFSPGHQVKLTFDGLYRSVNKISGIFNPTTYNQTYTFNGGERTAAVAQYQQLDTAVFTLTIPEDIEFPEGETSVEMALTNGYVKGSMLSAASPFHSMYYITDTGVGTNFSAVGVSYVLSRMADIPITITQKTDFDVKIQLTDGEILPDNQGFTLYSPEGVELTPDENGIYQDLPAGNYTYSFRRDGYILLDGDLKVSGYDVTDVVDGILTKTVAVAKPAPGAWDGYSVSEPEKDSAGVYRIGTAPELAWFAQTVNGGNGAISALLTADIDLSGCPWTPIGSNTAKFTGNFDGGSHTVSNLNVTNEAAVSGAGYGFIGYAVGSTVKNLTVEGTVYVTNSASVSNGYTAGVIGYGESLTIDNVCNKADVTAKRVKGNWYGVAGIVGNAKSCTITNCINDGEISGYSRVAGIAGSLTTGATIANCGNNGNVTASYQYAAGIAGYGVAGATFENCYNAGRITASQGYGAGIVTSNLSTEMIACYNTGDISGTGQYLGGLVARIANANGHLVNCFSTGTVDKPTSSGALAGQLTKAESVTKNLYYLEGAHTAAFGKTAAETQTATAVTAETLASRDFVIAMNEGLETAAFAVGENHPILRWQDPEAEVPTSGETPDVVYGDVDGKDGVDMSDVTLVQSFINGGTLEETAQLAADLDCKDGVDMTDLSLLLQYINGTITQLPVVETNG